MLEPACADYPLQFVKALAIARRNRHAKVAADRVQGVSPTDPLTLDTLGRYNSVPVASKSISADRTELASLCASPPK
jgi:hypothetical protein